MSLAALVRRMAEAGAPPAAIAIALEAIEAAQAAEARLAAKRPRSGAAIRQARYRKRKADAQRNKAVADNVVPFPRRP